MVLSPSEHKTQEKESTQVHAHTYTHTWKQHANLPLSNEQINNQMSVDGHSKSDFTSYSSDSMSSLAVVMRHSYGGITF